MNEIEQRLTVFFGKVVRLNCKEAYSIVIDRLNMLMVVFQVIYGLIYAIIYNVLYSARNMFPNKFSKNIDGEIVLITGGGSGIGRLIALKLANLGATIVTLDVNEKGNDETVRIIRKDGHQAYGFVCDLSSKDEIYSVAKTVKNQVGIVTILINNAGIVSGTRLLDTADDKIERTFDVNVLAHFWTIKTFLPDMINVKKGHIVTVASMAGHSGTNKLVDYCASKSANIGMDDALKVELISQGLDSMIKTTVVCPYYIATGMFQGVQSKVIPILDPEFVADETVKGILMNKPEVILPAWCSILIMLKSVIHTVPSFKLGQTFGFNCSMDQFAGRTKVLKNQ